MEAALPVYSAKTPHANADSYGLLWTGFGARHSLVIEDRANRKTITLAASRSL